LAPYRSAPRYFNTTRYSQKRKARLQPNKRLLANHQIIETVPKL
jgi:hypothetical protein